VPAVGIPDGPEQDSPLGAAESPAQKCGQKPGRNPHEIALGFARFTDLLLPCL
jgi:hypothetical protein